MASMSFAEKRLLRQRQRREMSQSRYGREESLKSNEQALKQCDKLNNDIDNALDRCLVITDQTAKCAADTAEALNDQRNQIKRIHKKTFETEQILDDSDRSLKSISSWKQQFRNKFRRKQEKKEYKEMEIEKQFAKRDRKEEKKKKKRSGDSKSLRRYQNHNDDVPADWSRVGTSRERKVEQTGKLRQIGNDLDMLMEMASSLGQELDDQRQMIKETTDKIDHVDDKITSKNRKIKHIMRQ